jgi:hypothetical protein
MADADARAGDFSQALHALALRGKPAPEARSGPDDDGRTADEDRVRHTTLEIRP